ncbi:hypothetical protein HAX54_033909 [Datura stramonium]|uniref:Uncharacterized protein n=1 Tax=Datura stramonium TaxID=4076 RepID=A0ABS8VFX1_DATST|nr:hypothetical protein [Datura stramonium]
MDLCCCCFRVGEDGGFWFPVLGGGAVAGGFGVARVRGKGGAPVVGYRRWPKVRERNVRKKKREDGELEVDRWWSLVGNREGKGKRERWCCFAGGAERRRGNGGSPEKEERDGGREVRGVQPCGGDELGGRGSRSCLRR